MSKLSERLARRKASPFSNVKASTTPSITVSRGSYRFIYYFWKYSFIIRGMKVLRQVNGAHWWRRRRPRHGDARKCKSWYWSLSSPWQSFRLNSIIIIKPLMLYRLDKDLTVLASRGRIVIIGSRGEVTINPRSHFSHSLLILNNTYFIYSSI